MSIGYKKQSAGSVPTPPVGQENTFIDSADDRFKKKLADGTIVDLQASAAGVASFEGRTGFVISAPGDYTANEITYVPSGGLSSITVQNAIDELDSEKAPLTHVGSTGVSQHGIATGSVAGFISPSDKTKLDSVATGATANDTDANLRARATHTGVQTASTISDFNTAADARVTAGLAIHTGASDPHPGYALDADVTAAQAYAIQRSNHTGMQNSSTISNFDASAKSAVVLNTLSGSQTDQAPSVLATKAGDTAAIASAAVYTDAAVAALVASAPATLDTLNELAVALGNDPSFATTIATTVGGKLAKASNLSDLVSAPTARNNLGLGNVDNTSDINKPVSTAQAAADTAATAAAQATSLQKSSNLGDLVSASTARTNLGLGNVDNTADNSKPVSTAQAAADAAVQAFSIQRANHTGTQSAATLTGLAAVATSGLKADVGLSNVDNTSDATKNAAVATLTNKTLTSPVINNPTGIVKGDVGLNLVDNTADNSKPVSTAQATADNLRALKSGDTFTGPVIAKGTNTGDGYVNYESQTSAPSTPSSGFRQFSDSLGRFAWKGVNGFVRTFNATGITADRIYSLPDATVTLMGDVLTTIGDIFYRNGSNVTSRLGIGSSNQLLRVVSGLPAWSDENLGQDFGDGNLGSATISGPLTLSSNVYYDYLTLDSACAITTNGYLIYAKTLDISNAPVGAIRWNGLAGNSSANQTGGSAGSALNANILGGSGSGSAGATGVVGAGVQAAAVTNLNPANGGGGGNGGGSGSGVNGGTTARAGGTVSNRVLFGRLEQMFLRGNTVIVGAAGGAGGASGGGDGVTVTNACGGGGGGSGAGMIGIFCNKLITSASTPSGVIQAIGGAGGNGRTALAAGNGGGGGAGGGGGGYIALFYNVKTGPVVSSLIQATGGVGGSGGSSVTGTGGSGGNGGQAGYIDVIDFGNLVGIHVGGSAGTVGGSAAGTVGGGGGTGGLANVSI